MRSIKRNKAQISAFEKKLIRLRNQRILLCFFLLVVCVLPPFFVNNPIGYMPGITLVLLFAVSFIYLIHIKSSLSFVAKFSQGQCSRGCELDFTIDVKNASRLMALRLDLQFFVSDLYGKADKEISSSTSILGKREENFCIEVSFAHIGIYTAGLNSIVIFDPLGLFFLKIPCDSFCTVEVTPNIVDSIDVDVSSELMRESERITQSIASDDMDYVGVRDYVIGDQMKSIHWKLSARKREHLTRLFETHINPSLTAVIDFHTPKYSTEELMCCNDALLETALSMENFARKNGFDTEIAFVDKDDNLVRSSLFAQSDIEEFFELIKSLPLPSPKIDKTNALDILRDGQGAFLGSGVILFCTSWLDEETLSSVFECRAKHKRVILFFIVPKAQQREFCEKNKTALLHLQTAAIIYFVIANATDLILES